MPDFVVGDPVRLGNTFRNGTTPADPTTVSLAVTNPAGVTTTYTYGAAEITRAATGVYYRDITATLPGDWHYVWTGTGALADVADGRFNVEQTTAAKAQLLDIITLAEGRAAVNLHASDTSQDAEVAAYITAVSRRLDQLVGPVVVRTITAEAHDARGATVRLDHSPVSSITSLTEYVGTTGTVLTAETVGGATTANDYYLDAEYGILTRRSGGTDTWWSTGRSRIVVTYVAGRFLTTAAVDPLFKNAAVIMLAHLWRRESGSEPMTAYQRSHGTAIPKVVREMLGEEWRLPVVA